MSPPHGRADLHEHGRERGQGIELEAIPPDQTGCHVVHVGYGPTDRVVAVCPTLPAFVLEEFEAAFLLRLATPSFVAAVRRIVRRRCEPRCGCGKARCHAPIASTT
ncbi:MAG TPA: hypothetical protein PL151_14115 [Phycisphaerae bacterium]|nr:hypothetical protein [Phycisphaerae bacterium]HOJ73480.1 hypothetical protein [Phycisphaerae bacterium]HOM51089.1 hypothetical protein [Phycisphaerae bacterium]HON68284.1 hypothetical protein [Phycisphaerae bacterium]HOQ85274.1 hypothetical protein [Phycisphaerae bacterium]